MDQLLAILESLHPGMNIGENDDLIGSGLLDSLDIVTLITEINSAFDVNIPAEEILPENFCSEKAIYALIQHLDEV